MSEQEPGQRESRLTSSRRGSGNRRGGLDRRILLGLIALAILAAVLLLAFLLLSNGQGGGDEGEQTNEPPPEAATSAIVRISGTEGLAFTGNYGVVEEGLESVEGRLGATPTDYEVPINNGPVNFDAISAVFEKQGAEGDLKVEILVDGEVVDSGETDAENGVVSVDYSPEDE